MHIFRFVLALVLFLGGIYVLASAFSFVGLEIPVFLGGILVSTLGLYLAVGSFKSAQN